MPIMGTMNTTPSQVWLVAQIEAERAAKGMTIKDLADRAGIGERTLPRYLSQERDLSLSQLDDIATALGIGFDVLVKRAQQRRDGV